MKIGIDISQIVYGTGVSVYTRELVKALLKEDQNNHYILFGGSLRMRDEIWSFVNSLNGDYAAKVKLFPPAFADFFWNRLHTFKVEKMIGDVDVFHSSDWSEPPSNASKVTTIHDLTPVLFESETDTSVAKVHRRKLHWVKNESKAIIAPSISTKADLVDLGFNKEKIAVIYEGPRTGISKKPLSEVKSTLSNHRISGKYLLAVGTKKRKNLKRIMEGYEKQKVDLGLSNLIIVGEPGFETGVKGVRYMGKVSDNELSCLYSGAESLVYASLYEGFGLPILDAFACECPVVTSNVSSMPEVAGDAAVLVDPKDVDSISEGILKASKTRQGLIEKGSKRLRLFSWKKAAKETIKLYESLS